MPKMKLFLRRFLLLLFCLLLLQEILPVTKLEASGLQLRQVKDSHGEKAKTYALCSNGDLITWSCGPLTESGDFLPIYPYFYMYRRTAARRVISFSTWTYAILYVDQEHVLWEKSDNEPKPTRLMEDVAQVAASANYSFALKTDGSLWSWGKNHFGHLGLGWEDMNSYPPQKILDNIQSVFIIGEAPFCSPFAVTKNNTLLYWGPNTGGIPTVAAENVKELSILTGYLYQYLTPQGEVYTLPVFSENSMPKRIAEDVCTIFDGGLIKNDHTQWLWEGSEEKGNLIKVRNGVQTAADRYFYADTYGRMHWCSSSWMFPAPSRSARSLNPILRNLFLMVLVPWLLYKQYQRKNVRKVRDAGEKPG